MLRQSTTARQKLYDLEVEKAINAGLGEQPICNLCFTRIMIGQLWHQSHNRHLPKALGGFIDGIAHVRCNLLHAQQHDVPLIAKGKRIRAKHTGAYRPAHIMPGSRASGLKKKMDGTVERRAIRD